MGSHTLFLHTHTAPWATVIFYSSCLIHDHLLLIKSVARPITQLIRVLGFFFFFLILASFKHWTLVGGHWCKLCVYVKSYNMLISSEEEYQYTHANCIALMISHVSIDHRSEFAFTFFFLQYP